MPGLPFMGELLAPLHFDWVCLHIGEHFSSSGNKEFGWWDDIAKLIPYLSVHMNTGFYLVFSTGLLIIWLMMFFVFDRLTYWRIRPGQMTEEHLIGGAAESFDTNGLRFQKLGSDFFRAVLGLGAGDTGKLAAGVGGLNRVSWCRSKSARTPSISQYRDGLGYIQGKNLAVSYLPLGRATSTVPIVIAFSGDPTMVSSRLSRRADRRPSLLPKTASAPSLSPAWEACWVHCAFADALCAWRLT